MKKKILEIHQLLNRALTIAIDEYNDAWIVAEWAVNQTVLEGYGYTEELEERIQDLEERLEKLQEVEGRLPPLTSLVDAMKMEYFLEHFQEIPLEALEWIVQEMRNK